MAKRPVPGAVKTRLCPPLTPEQAADLALAMLDDTVLKCLACAAFETALCVAPAEEVVWFRERYPRVRTVEAQRGAGLGERLADHFERASRELPGWTLACVGADQPHVPAERIAEAHAALESGADVVLGPDLGGGYYLVGLARPIPELLTRVPMSTPDMCERTMALARSLGLSVRLLEPDYDVDEPGDLARLAEDPRAPRSSRLARSLLAHEP